MKPILDFLDTSFEGGGGFLSGLLDEFTGKKQPLLEAKFGKERDLFSRRYHGFSLGTKSMSIAQSRNHCILVAPSGVGKTTGCLIPTAIRVGSGKNPASLFINDPSREIRRKLKHFFLSRGYDVRKFDPNDPENSLHYNPLHWIRSAADINKVANMIVEKANKESKDFWAIKSKELIALIIGFLLNHAPKVNQNLANVYFLLQNLAGDQKTINGLFADKSTQQEWIAYKGVIANSPNTKASIISSAIASLSFIGTDPVLCDLTSVDTMPSISQMRQEPIAIFLTCPLSDAGYYQVLLGLMFEQVFAQVFSTLPRDDENDIFLLIDELSSIPLPGLANVISNARKFKLPILGVLQSESQLYENYGQYNAKSILNNATRIYMTGLQQECQSLETALGNYQYYEDKQKKVLRTRPLMSADEIRCMPRNQALVLPNGGMRPLLVKFKPYYQVSKFVSFTQLSEPSGHQPPTPIRYRVQYLPLDTYNNLPCDE